jgi:sugar O-acyltransferase (sialic acid O-acetyltransferase NeuD family)
MKLLIAGAGGHGRVVADAASLDPRWTEVAFLDDRHPSILESGAWPVVGTFADLERLGTAYGAVVPAVGDARLRLRLVAAARAAGLTVPVVAHPRATISRHSALGAGTVAFAGSVVNVGATLGEACIVNTGATVDHDCKLGDGVHVCPGAHLAGDVFVGARTWIGIGAVVRQGVRIGADVTVGAGAACVAGIADAATVMGVPAREKSR